MIDKISHGVTHVPDFDDMIVKITKRKISREEMDLINIQTIPL